jgi:hypothetical protein
MDNEIITTTANVAQTGKITCKMTGLLFTCDDTAGVIKWIQDYGIPDGCDYSEVKIKLDGIEKKFTLADFKQRLGF